MQNVTRKMRFNKQLYDIHQFLNKHAMVRQIRVNTILGYTCLYRCQCGLWVFSCNHSPREPYLSYFDKNDNEDWIASLKESIKKLRNYKKYDILEWMANHANDDSEDIIDDANFIVARDLWIQKN